MVMAFPSNIGQEHFVYGKLIHFQEEIQIGAD